MLLYWIVLVQDTHEATLLKSSAALLYNLCSSIDCCALIYKVMLLQNDLLQLLFVALFFGPFATSFAFLRIYVRFFHINSLCQKLYSSSAKCFWWGFLTGRGTVGIFHTGC